MENFNNYSKNGEANESPVPESQTAETFELAQTPFEEGWLGKINSNKDPRSVFSYETGQYLGKSNSN